MTVAKHLYAIGTLATILTAASFGTARVKAAPAPPGGTSNVNVVNTTSNPVPTAAQGTTTVSGTVAISGTPSVSVSGTPSVSVSGTPSVSISGTPSVSVSGTPSVTVGNTPSNPVPVAITSGNGGTPVEFVLQGVWNGGQLESSATPYVVPTGKRLVMQFVSGYATIGVGDKVLLTSFGDDLLPMQDMGHGPREGQGDWEHFQGAQQVTAVVNSNYAVYGSCRRGNGDTSGNWAVIVHGYLEDAP